ncbi:hypothetical protein [Comamonas thiooxydans]|uniref:hypothetical protein n=1 Tax=Comamonas thiooxydans TaxID=363952 RepID=UPI000B41F2B0|nr:hypothetical protein [Comamonas thiooxydans]
MSTSNFVPTNGTVDQSMANSDTQGALPEITVHDFKGMDSGDVYDRTQTDSAIKDGDVLDLGNGNVAILVAAWPTVVTGEIEHFHHLKEGRTFEAFKGGKYLHSAEKAREVARKAAPQSAAGHIADSTHELYIKAAANTIADLRKVDVFRVIDGVARDNIDGVTRDSLAAWIKSKRPELATEVDEVLADLAPAPLKADK